MKHLIYLIAGIVITAIFIALGASGSLFEAFYYSQGMSDGLYNLGLYPTTTLITVLLAWGMAAVYYYVINSVRFDRWYHWLVMLAITVLATPIISYLYLNHALAADGQSYPQEMVNFELVNAMLAAALYVVASYSLRWWSSNCRHTPIPQ